MNNLTELLGDLFEWRCPACSLRIHEQCDPLVEWLCCCSSGARLTRLTTNPEGEHHADCDT